MEEWKSRGVKEWKSGRADVLIRRILSAALARDHEIPPWRRSRSAIRPRRTAASMEACASASGGSPRPAFRPAAMSGHETPPSRHTNALPLHLLCLSPSKSRTVLGHARVLDSSTFPPLHFSTTPLFHFSTTPLFHFSTSHPHCAGKFGILCRTSKAPLRGSKEGAKAQ